MVRSSLSDPQVDHHTTSMGNSEKIRISKTDLVAPGQIGWVFYFEGDAELAAKVMREKESNRPYLSLPTCYRFRKGCEKGVRVHIINYPRPEIWRKKRQELLGEFRRQVGDDYFYSASPLFS